MSVHVDDILLASNDPQKAARKKRHLQNFAMHDLGEARFITEVFNY